VGRWPSMCCPHAGSRSTSTPTASCLMRRTSWPCRWALRGQMGTPRGHHCRGVWAVWSPHPHLGTDGDTPRPPLQGYLGTVATPSSPWGHPMATALGSPGHRGPPIPTLGTPHGHGSGDPEDPEPRWSNGWARGYPCAAAGCAAGYSRSNRSPFVLRADRKEEALAGREVAVGRLPCRAVPPQQGGDSFVPPCRRRRACR